MVETSFTGKQRVEFHDIFILDEEGYWHLNENFVRHILEYFPLKIETLEIKKRLKEFVVKKDIENIEQLAEELKVLKKSFETLNKKKSEKVSGELKSFEVEIKKLKGELESLREKSKQELFSFVEEKKQQLNKKFLEEISKPISNKNKSIKEVLVKFYNGCCNGIAEQKEKESFIEKFKEVIPELSIDIKTKDNLLEICTNEQLFWERDNENFEREWSNNLLYQALRNLINKISAGYEADKIYLIKTGKKEFHFKVGEDKIKSDKEPKENIEALDNKQEEQEEDDYYGD